MKSETKAVPTEDLIAARKRSGLTQKAAAELMYISREMWCDWEKGKSGIRRGVFEMFLVKTEQHPIYGNVEAEKAEVISERQKTRELKEEITELEQEIFNLQAQVNALTEGVQ